jgi:hypothetical protein
MVSGTAQANRSGRIAQLFYQPAIDRDAVLELLRFALAGKIGCLRLYPKQTQARTPSKLQERKRRQGVWVEQALLTKTGPKTSAVCPGETKKANRIGWLFCKVKPLSLHPVLCPKDARAFSVVCAAPKQIRLQ